ncbi:MAG: hypothetical protein JOY54_21150 [Acidobacteriaceae bacterium]|nr:hypothetical protein [Acidobacteriaceae bacterium]
MSSKAQVAANRANAQLSTGPKSEEGKAKSSLNAVKTGLTGRTVLLPTDDASAYEAHIARFFKEWDPATDAERALVQSLADTEWRLLRIPSLEAGIYALGRLEFADKFAHEEEQAVRKSLIEAQVFLTYRRDLNNLSIQESRLRRQRENDTAELKELQEQRRREHDRQLRQAVALYKEFKGNGSMLDPEEFGFEFSIEEIEESVARMEARNARSQYPDYLAQDIQEQLENERLALKKAA